MTTTLDKFIGSRAAEDRSQGAPQVKLEVPGAWFAGKYIGQASHDYQGKPSTFYRFALEGWDNATFGSDGKVVPSTGEMVRIYGKYLAGQITPDDIDKTLVVSFLGLGPKVKGKNPAKVLKVQVLA